MFESIFLINLGKQNLPYIVFQILIQKHPTT